MLDEKTRLEIEYRHLTRIAEAIDRMPDQNPIQLSHMVQFAVGVPTLSAFDALVEACRDEVNAGVLAMIEGRRAELRALLTDGRASIWESERKGIPAHKPPGKPAGH